MKILEEKGKFITFRKKVFLRDKEALRRDMKILEEKSEDMTF